MSTPIRRSARIASMNAPVRPTTRSMREVPELRSVPTTTPIKISPQTIPTTPKKVPRTVHEFYHSPELVAARAAAAALYPAYSNEYYDELEKCPALHKWRAAVWAAEWPSISKGW